MNNHTLFADKSILLAAGWRSVSMAVCLFCSACVSSADKDCKKTPIMAQEVVRQEGYLIVQDGSSFYYLDKEKTFISGPLNGWQGRTIHGAYEVIAPWAFSATGIVTRVNEPCTPTPCKMKMTVNAVKRESTPFDAKFLMLTAWSQKEASSLPHKPVVHQAYFVFDYLIPVNKEPAPASQ